MHGASFERLRQFFNTAIELPADERAAYIDAQPDIDHHTRRQLDDLLHADADVKGEATRRAAADDARQARTQDWSGRQSCAYRIERTLGHGGMGTVFRAHRTDGSLEQKVAIKVVRPELLSSVMLARFRLERQVLALLQHPNIPKMLDTGGDSRRRALCRAGIRRRRSDRSLSAAKAARRRRTADPVSCRSATPSPTPIAT